MKRALVLIIVIVTMALVTNAYVMAGGDMTGQKPIEVKVQLGDGNNSMIFSPADLELETGKLYKLVLHNASGIKHYFSSDGLSRSVFTRKVQVLGPDGKTIAEIKGVI